MAARPQRGGRGPSGRAGFYGLDLYNMRGSIAAVLDYLDKVDPEAAAVARERYGCLTPWQKEPSTYGRAVLTAGYRKCEQAVIEQCRELLRKRLDYARAGRRELPRRRAERAAGRRRPSATTGSCTTAAPESWNLRDTHMFETLEHLLEARGPRSKAVVWAHNSHIGDARYTEMGLVREELNIGQLCRERFGDDGGPDRLRHAHRHGRRRLRLGRRRWRSSACAPRTATATSGSATMRACRASCSICGRDEALRRRLLEPRLERFIGVIYRPETELMSHYAEASLPQQFDAFVWFDETTP